MKTILGLLLFANWVSAADLSTLIQRGDVYDQQLQPDKALQYYLPAEKQAPTNASLLVKIARQYVFRMDSLKTSAEKLALAQTALGYAQRAVKAAPKEGDGYLSMAIVYGKMTPLLGNREKIELSKKIKEASEKAVQLAPQNDYAWHMLGRWHQALAGMGSLTRSLAQLVYGELPEASHEEAIRCFKKAIQLNSERLIHYIELGRTYAQMGDTAQARQWIEKGLAMPNREKDDPETKSRGRRTLNSL
ncbi:TPR repeat-containing protein [Prosthecobacter debontii]|uniref:Regulator of microtubule dynamics protein 1 n=1 Tax=Prosthecobacter debontii TaxID=48467 RepID=A0A1T4YE36_9BACT|nr:hypothetical protein [Prosthecobacter debontii]SKB00092.1 TPR repeat-containing protein [Prosthecobacter debontii]